MKAVQSVAAVGWDSHRRFSTLTLRDDSGAIVERRRIEHADRPAMRRTLASWPADTPVVLEGTFGWSWISDELAAAGHRPHLASSRKLAAWRQARGLAKSNRLDADLLSELMSEKSRWWEVWLPPMEVREQRELLRYRMGLVRTQTAFKNRTHAILHRHGVLHDLADLFGAAGRRFLQRLANDQKGVLAENARIALKGELQLLDHLRRQIASATRLFRARVQRSPIATRLMSLPGVSWILAYTLLAEIGRIERFKNSKHLASYSLLAPRASDSGDDDGSNPQGRRVGHAGRSTLQWAFIEAAHGAVRGDARMRDVFNRCTDGGKRNRNRGYIAVARHLSICAYVVWKKDVDYSPTPPPRPGSKQRRREAEQPRARETEQPRARGAEQPRARETEQPRARETEQLRARETEQPRARGAEQPRRRREASTNRPGTGQPDHPMVAVP
jgi:transposase